MTTPTLLLAGLRATGFRSASVTVPRSRAHVVVATRLVVVAALVVAVVSIPAIPSATHTTLGLLFAGVPGVPIAIGLSGLGFVLAVRSGSVVDAWVATVVSVLCMRLPIALGAGAPIYSWTYKHLGVVDWIQHHGHVATGVDIYAGWPGVFAAIAWFSTATGISPVSIAQWFEVGADIALVGAVGALARSLGTSRLSAVTAAFIVGVANWVGQDYLSPQAVSFLLGIVIVTLLVRSRTRPVLGWLTLPLFAAIAVSHQLTPYWLLVVAAAFGVLGTVRPRTIVVPFGILAGLMVLLNWHLVQEYTTGQAFDPLANAQTVSTGAGSIGMTVTALAARAVSLGVWGSAGLLVLAGLRPDRFGGTRLRRWSTLRLAVVAFAPFALLAGQSYGGEAIYRVFLYSVPGCAVLIAPVLVRCIRAGVRGRVDIRTGGAVHARRSRSAVLAGRLALTGTAVAVVVASLASGQAVYGAWFSNLVTPAELSVSTQLLETAPVPSQLLAPAAAGPGRMTEQYVDQARVDPQFDASMTTWAGWAGQSFRDPAVEQKLTTALRGGGRPVYMLITDQMVDWAEYNGTYPHGALQRLSGQIAADPRWTTVVSAPGVVLYRLTGTTS
ncbi:hypothetical protein [Curtobacterium sp. MCBD17_028]|uniref:hypothetical protein n=1 Tax=Curtobacterium sp. MCBD17_028 TaxID=2175670 RepID=UPI000DA8A911|nr:hypothetical protein [Curtobacterium sp. MCBD17_028]PZE23065.1 hypothetical protein DEI86_15680 [Curtobacterium sp. MCBD17_028]